jgi:hypothetical protein
MAEVAARVPWWRRAWIYGLGTAAAAAAAAVLAIALRPAAVPAPPKVALARPAAPALAAAKRTAARPVWRIHRAPAPAAASPKPEPLLVELLTDDPDVVIYWIADEGDR